MNAEQIINEIKSFSKEDYAAHHLRFFKTAEGEYGEGDLFYGLKVPEVRKISNKYFKAIDLKEIDILIKNPYHEVRLCALCMMVERYKKTTDQEKDLLVEIYLNNIAYINNWDLVDVSAGHILGPHWHTKDLSKLWELARSNHLWSERVAILTTFEFIRKGDYRTTLELCEFFLNHKHDLIHKATGWLLREIGKRDLDTLHAFLNKFHKVMPRTMLRYSIEKLSQYERIFYMKK